MKTNKRLAIIIAATAALVVAIIVVAVCINSCGKSEMSGQGETVVVTDKDGKVVKKMTKEEASKEAKKKDSAWDGVEVVEEGTKAAKDKQVIYKRNKKGEIVTKKNGEKVTRKASYAGEDEGWSPIVTPDDLKKDK